MLAGDLLLVSPDEGASAHDVFAPDEEPVDAVRRREDEAGDWIVRTAELETVGSPDREIGALPRLQRAEVVPAEDGCAASRPEPQRLARGQRRRAAATTGDEQRLLHLEEQVAALVRGGAVDAEADADTGVEQVTRPGDPGAEAKVRGRAVRDPDLGPRERGHVRVGEVDAVRAPDVAG